MLRRLKFEALCQGVAPSDAALAALPIYQRGTIIVRDYPTTSGLILRLSDEIYVNARLRFDNPRAFVLDHDGSGFHLIAGDEKHPVDVFSPPLYALENRRLSTGRSIRAVANTHADRVRLTPIHGCAWHCQFCNYPSISYRRNTIEELAEALRIALSDRIVDPPHVLISGGTPRMEQADYDHMNKVCSELPAMFPDLSWDFMLAPRPLHPGRRTRRTYTNMIRRLKDCGFEALSINLELNSDDARNHYISEKHEIGRDDYLTFLELAVEQFGVGKVRSVLLVGLESDTETLTAVEALATRGVLVELSPFTADPGTFLAQHPEPTTEQLMTIYEKAMDTTIACGVPMTPFCLPCSHNIL